ncbi:hypothetical protein KUCAC02_031754 [Chaenocephalus aceratus]|nr:hypothetical protein KUCAC02_031754 [Chaenocephalus aceratus]
MHHLPQTFHTHKCSVCGLELHTFVRGDTLLGEHIYHSHVLYRACPYITQRFLGMEQELMLTIGRERYRRGFVAFHQGFAEATRGFALINKLNRCLVCSAAALPGCYLPFQGHRPGCDRIKAQVCTTLEGLKILP